MPNLKDILRIQWPPSKLLKGIEEVKGTDKEIYHLYHRVVEMIVKNVYIERMLEIGPWDGGVFKDWLAATQDDPERRPSHVTMIDNWNEQFLGVETKDYSHIDKIAKDYNYRGKLEKLTGDSHQILPELIRRGRKFDLILVDGDHSYHGQWLDIKHSWALLNDTGVMIIDDIHNKQAPWIYWAYRKFCESVYKQIHILREFALEGQPGCVAIIKVL